MSEPSNPRKIHLRIGPLVRTSDREEKRHAHKDVPRVKASLSILVQGEIESLPNRASI